MELIGAFATGIAVFAGLMALLPDRQRPTLCLRDRLRGWRRRRMAGAADLLGQARLEVSPRSYLLLTRFDNPATVAADIRQFGTGQASGNQIAERCPDVDRRQLVAIADQ